MNGGMIFIVEKKKKKKIFMRRIKKFGELIFYIKNNLYNLN